jgi:Putative Actinobacterial Holin-X, holin superfamily III
VIETVSVSDSTSNRRRRRNLDETSIPELVEYLRTYVKQETVDPLRGIGRWIAYGVAGAFCLGLGLVIVLLGVLRLIEEEWDRAATGSLSWLAYLVTLIVAAAILAITILRIKKSTLNKEPK